MWNALPLVCSAILLTWSQWTYTLRWGVNWESLFTDFSNFRFARVLQFTGWGYCLSLVCVFLESKMPVSVLWCKSCHCYYFILDYFHFEFPSVL